MEKQTVVPLKQMAETKASGFRRTLGYYLTQLPVQLLAKTSVTPNAVSWFGVLLTLAAAVLIITGQLFVAGIMVLVAGFFDMLDGALARSTNRVSKFGAILDSTLDRFSEAVLLLSLLAVYAAQQSMLGIWAVGLALLGSYLVSYIRARAEGMGIDCEVGIFARPERVVALALGLLLAPINSAFLTAALGVIIVFSFIAAGQRLYHAWIETKK
ncbi:MAG: CDP-alcohol phosphatidyltransferase family protein [Chloroflexota bacterium]